MVFGSTFGSDSASDNAFSNYTFLGQQFGKCGNKNGEFQFPHDIKLDLKNSLIFIADYYNKRIQIFDLKSKIYKYSFNVPKNPLAICFTDKNYENLYISCKDQNIYKYSININNNKFKKLDDCTIEIGDLVNGLAMDFENHHLYVTCEKEGTVKVISTNNNNNNNGNNKQEITSNSTSNDSTIGVDSTTITSPRTSNATNNSTNDSHTNNSTTTITSPRNSSSTSTTSIISPRRSLSALLSPLLSPRGTKSNNNNNNNNNNSLSSDGLTTLLHTISLKGMFPIGITLDTINKLIFVSDSGHHNIQVFHLETFEHLKSISKEGKLEGYLKSPHGIDFNPKNRSLIVCDKENNRIQIFNSENGELISCHEHSGCASDGEFHEPRYCAIDYLNSNSTEIYVTEFGKNHRVIAFKPIKL
ncbi:hypothetical protein ABK040_007587 [Willaertia magna]